ncbi:MAG: CHAT domain-containing protein [Cyanobacteria bacterium P01_D01_bin.73]
MGGFGGNYSACQLGLLGLGMGAALAIATPLRAQITPAQDGINTQVQTSGSNFTITGGQTSSGGENLFHSFDQFGVGIGETANFVTPSSTQSVLGRVGGGTRSVIDGTIQLTGSNADLYLLNPAGVVFGQNVLLDVPASFGASTATGFGFGSDPLGQSQWFGVGSGDDVSAFAGMLTALRFDGLTNGATGAIANFGKLSVAPGSSLWLVGGTVLNRGDLIAPGGAITVSAVEGNQLLRLRQPGSLLQFELRSLGNVQPALGGGITPLSMAELLTGTESLRSAEQATVLSNGLIQLTQATDTNATVNFNMGPAETFISGIVDASGQSGSGGQVVITGSTVVAFDGLVDSSGSLGGGRVLIGGDESQQGLGLPMAQDLSLQSFTVDASALQQGNGGVVSLFAERTANFFGSVEILAGGGAFAGNGGLVEISSTTNISGASIDADPSSFTTLTTLSSFQSFVEVGAVPGQGNAGEIVLNPPRVMAPTFPASTPPMTMTPSTPPTTPPATSPTTGMSSAPAASSTGVTGSGGMSSTSASQPASSGSTQPNSSSSSTAANSGSTGGSTMNSSTMNTAMGSGGALGGNNPNSASQNAAVSNAGATSSSGAATNVGPTSAGGTPIASVGPPAPSNPSSSTANTGNPTNTVGPVTANNSAAPPTSAFGNPVTPVPMTLPVATVSTTTVGGGDIGAATAIAPVPEMETNQSSLQALSSNDNTEIRNSLFQPLAETDEEIQPYSVEEFAEDAEVLLSIELEQPRLDIESDEPEFDADQLATRLDFSNILLRGVGDDAAAYRQELIDSLQTTSTEQIVGKIEHLRAMEFGNHWGVSYQVPLIESSLDSIQEVLRAITQNPGKMSAVFYTLAHDDGLELVLVLPTGQPFRHTVKNVSSKELKRTIARFRRKLTNRGLGSLPTYLPPSQKLYRWIIEPFRGVLDDNGVEVIQFSLDPGLRSLPLAALHDGEQFLIENFAVAAIPSFALLNNDYQPLEDSTVLVAGTSQFEALPELPAVPVEAKTIHNHWNTVDLIGEDFTLEQIRTARQWSNFAIAHLATHAFFEPGDRQDSYVQLWGNERVGIDAIGAFNFQTPPLELLVLSACRTAVGDAQAEMGFAGISVKSGAKSVVASLWQVSDSGTLALMSEFYNALSSLPTKVESLRQAQLAMLRGEVTISNNQLQSASQRAVPLPSAITKDGQNIDFTHPYFWSSFTLIGSPW